MNEGHVVRRVEFIDLARQRDRIRERMDSAIARVLDHAQFILGPEVEALEQRLASFCGARHAVGCASGTDALILALLAKGLRSGEAVIVPSFSFCATAEAVCLLGGVPVFADVLEETYNLDPRSLEEAIRTARRQGMTVRGAITVDLFGQPCDYDLIEPIVRENGLWLIVDAAQSFGGSYRGRKVGTIGAITATSFFPAKPLGCYGDGGAVFTDDDELAETLRSLRVHGSGRHKYDNVRIGINGRLDTLQAAVLLEKLAIFPDEIAARNHIARTYEELLPRDILRPAVLPGVQSVWAQYTVRMRDRDTWSARLKSVGVPAAVYYPRPLHRQHAYREFPTVATGLPTSETLAETVLSLPMHPYLSDDDLAMIAAAFGSG